MTVTIEASAAPRIKRRRISVSRAVALIILLSIVLFALVGPLLVHASPTQTDVLAANEPPSSEHWLGTDALGRDLFARIVYGGRLTLLAPAIVVVAATTVGVVLAFSAAWFRGGTDTLISRLCDVLMACPSLLLAVLAVAMIGTGLVAPVIALSIAYAPFMARATRSVVLRERNLPYVEACQLAGFSGWRINSRHLLPNVRSLIAAQASFMYGAAMVDLAALSFIGLGVQPPQMEWGLQMAQSRTDLLDGLFAGTLVPGLLIVLVVISVNLLGASLFTPKER